MKLNTSLRYVNQRVTNRLYQNGSNRNPASNYIWMLPNMSKANLNPYKDENNDAFNYQGEFNNPYWNIYENTNQDELNRVVANLTLDWKIIEGLSLARTQKEEFASVLNSNDSDINALFKTLEEFSNK